MAACLMNGFFLSISQKWWDGGGGVGGGVVTKVTIFENLMKRIDSGWSS